jgi:hypothetical protein
VKVDKGNTAKLGSPEYYREKACAVLKKAETVTDPEVRTQLKLLADHWHRLAQSIEHPNW